MSRPGRRADADAGNGEFVAWACVAEPNEAPALIHHAVGQSAGTAPQRHVIRRAGAGDAAASRPAGRAGAGQNAGGARLHALRRSAGDSRGADASVHVQCRRRVRRADADVASMIDVKTPSRNIFIEEPEKIRSKSSPFPPPPADNAHFLTEFCKVISAP